MTWEEAVESIRNKPEFAWLIDAAYLRDDLVANVQAFVGSLEFQLTIQFIRWYCPGCKRVLDIGSGNGISCIAFALYGYEVVALEPDPSNLLGYQAIEKLKRHYQLSNLMVRGNTAEDTVLENQAPFDLVYARQSMHHAHNLSNFIANTARYLRSSGMFFTVRDHIIFDEADKQLFLKQHPLHHLYGGENAYTEIEYIEAFAGAGLRIKKVIKFFDSPINYFPMTQPIVDNLIRVKLLGHFSSLRRLGKMADFFFNGRQVEMAKAQLEKNFAGRMYSFIALKD